MEGGGERKSEGGAEKVPNWKVPLTAPAQSTHASRTVDPTDVQTPHLSLSSPSPHPSFNGFDTIYDQEEV